MKYSSPFLLAVCLLLLTFGCSKNKEVEEIEFTPLSFSYFPTCEGSQLNSNGTLTYSVFATEADWMTGSNPIRTGNETLPYEMFIPDLVDGARYYYDIQLDGRDNWFGGNVTAATANNYSFVYQKKGLNPILPTLYYGRTDVLGTYLLTDVLVGGNSTLNDQPTCVQDNFLVIQKGFVMEMNEGAEVCPSTPSTEPFAFYYQNCSGVSSEELENYQSEWFSKPGNEKITFAKENGRSQLSMEVLTTTGPKTFVYVRQ